MAKEDSVIEELLDSGLVDWVPLYDVVWTSVIDEAELPDRALVRTVLEALFVKDLMVPGDLGQSGFEDWPGSEDIWIERAMAEFDRSEGLPPAGFWLRLTEHGRAVARLNEASR